MDANEWAARTPLRLECVGLNVPVIRDAQGTIVATLHGRDGLEIGQRLAAAPELADVAEALVNAWNTPVHDSGEMLIIELSRLVDAAKDALARTYGRT